MKKEVVVVGSINLDLVASSSRIPLPGRLFPDRLSAPTPAEKAQTRL